MLYIHGQFASVIPETPLQLLLLLLLLLLLEHFLDRVKNFIAKLCCFKQRYD